MGQGYRCSRPRLRRRRAAVTDGGGNARRGRTEALGYLLGDLAAGQVGREQGALVHGQVVLGRHDAELIGLQVHAHSGQRLPQARGGPGQQDPDAVLAPRREGARDDLVWRIPPGSCC
jgi:hypothetical protein